MVTTVGPTQASHRIFSCDSSCQSIFVVLLIYDEMISFRTGWHLGELGEFRKMTCFELATRVPLIIRVPWMQTIPRYSYPVELVDIYPTICDLAGIPLPQGEDFDGISLVPYLSVISDVDGNPTVANTTPKIAAFSQYPRRVTDPARPWHGNSIIHHNRSTFTHMGLSIRTTQYRLTKWLVWNQSSLSPIWNNVSAVELYDHRDESLFPVNFDDPSENANVAGDAGYGDVIEELAALLAKQFGS